MSSMSPPVILFILLSTWALSRFLLNRRTSDVPHLPGPPVNSASWIWGHELQAFQHEATQCYSKWMSAFGPLFKVKGALLHSDIIVAGDHAAVQHIFANNLTYVKSPAFRPPIANLIGKGLVWAEGDDHAQQRLVIAPAFTPESIKGMADDISECAEKLESRLTNLVLANGGAATVNIVDHMSDCTLDIIGRVAFGHDFKAGQSTEARDIRRSWSEHVNLGLTFGAFVATLVLRAVPSITSLPFKALRAQGETKVIVNKLARRLVERGAHNDKGRDILSILMRGKKQGGLTADQIIDNISTFTMVGHETTAGSLNFCLLELARNPEVQQKLRDEILKHGRDLSYDDLQKLEYLDAVVKEALRIHPASPQTERLALKDDVIPLHTPIVTPSGKVLKALRIQKGQVFHIPFMSMQRNPAVWGADAHAFHPERWLTPGALPPASALPHGWSHLVTFCDGPRNCIGYRLAVLEFKAILATLVRTLAFRETTAVVRQRISPTLQPVTDGAGGVLPLHVMLAETA